MANVADYPTDIQRKICYLETFCNKCGLTVNMDKTKIIVFRNGGLIKDCENCYYAEKTLL